MVKGKNPKGLSVINKANQLLGQLYNTLIVEVNRDEKRLILRNGGWETVHTKKCMNLILEHYQLPYYVYQKNYLWYVANQNTGQAVPFIDGMELPVQ